MKHNGNGRQPDGYSSPSQFGREYSRFFGEAPARDIAKLRQDVQLAV